MFQIGAEPADPGGDRLAGFGVAAELARQGQQAQRRIENDIGRPHRARQRDPLRLAAVVALAELDVMTVWPLLQRDGLAARGIAAERRVGAAGLALAVDREGAGVAALRIIRAADKGAEAAELQAQPALAAAGAQPRVGPRAVLREEMAAELGVERLEHRLDGQLPGPVDRRREIAPEITQQRLPVDPPARHLVELVFQIGGEIVFDVALEEAGQERGDQPAAVLRHKPAPVEPHVIAVLQHLDDRGIGRRPADAQFLELLDQAGLAIARRRLGEMLVRDDRAALEPLAVAHRRQAAVLVIRASFINFVVAVFLVQLQKAVEQRDRAGGVQPHPAAWVGDVDADLVEQRRGHLARHRALPDQFVEPPLVIVEVAGDVGWTAREVGRADRFVRLLRVLRRAAVDARLGRQVAAAEFVRDQLARRGDRLGRDRDAVGPHIGDQPDRVAVEIDALVEPLRDRHRPGRAEAELARGFLLQGRGRERRKRVAANFAMLDRGDAEPAGLQDRVGGGAGLRLAVEIEAVEPLAVEMRQSGGEALARLGREIDLDRPVFARAERLDFTFALADQAQCHRLHAAGRAAARQFAP